MTRARALGLGLAVATAWPAAAQRPVDGVTITSTSLPAARIELDATLTYVGNQTITLSGGTRAEQHFFVEADRGRIKRLYWIQFEGKPAGGRPFNYSSDPTVVIGGQQFHTNFRFYPTAGFGGRAGSDGDQAQRLLEASGLRLGTDLARVRLVWLLDEPPLNELMIIYLEDLADHGLTVAALREDEARWEALSAELLARARAGLQVKPLEP